MIMKIIYNYFVLKNCLNNERETSNEETYGTKNTFIYMYNINVPGRLFGRQ